jgi:DnaK suppressor protein
MANASQRRTAEAERAAHARYDELKRMLEARKEAIEFALIEMKAETLSKIDEALSRLECGTYGRCFECGGEIGEARLRALPFAVRCKRCEEVRETAQLRDRMRQRRESAHLAGP